MSTVLTTEQNIELEKDASIFPLHFDEENKQHEFSLSLLPELKKASDYLLVKNRALYNELKRLGD